MQRSTKIFGACITLIAIKSVLFATETDPQSRFAPFETMKIHYTNRGEGKQALVFVHGWSCDSTFWKAQLDAFPQTRVIAIDLPGHGESDKPEIAYDMDLHARAIDAVLRDAKVDRAVLVGHSNGTPVIRQFYRKYPEKTRALVIVDGALRPFADAAVMEKFIGPMRAPNYRDYIGQVVDAMTRPMKDQAARAEIKEAMLRTPQFVSVSEMEAITKPELWKEDQINVPTLMIMAKQPAWSADYERFVRGLVPDLDYQVWEGVSHFLMIDKPQEFNAAVAGFLAKLGTR
ncbi:MAG: alpha/beta hydrolase [Verrucomicrobiota bacterium]|nr:alpha/beta hydrolase [Verrucomicrobiota bacterium]